MALNNALPIVADNSSGGFNLHAAFNALDAQAGSNSAHPGTGLFIPTAWATPGTNIGDGAVDAYPAFQACVTAACAVKGCVFIPAPTALYYLSQPISITAPVTILGASKFATALLFAGVDGFTIANGVNFVTLSNFSIAQAVRYTNTPNTCKGIRVLGTTAVQSYRHTYRDLFIDGFETAVLADGICSSVLDNVESDFGKVGLQSGGLTLNNYVSNCRFNSNGLISGSCGIHLGDGTPNNPEGWVISHTLVYNFYRGVWMDGAAYCKVRDCIIDYSREYGVLLASGATGATSVIDVTGCYIAFSGAATYGVYLSNSVAIAAGQDLGHTIRDNTILVYAGSTLTYGIYCDGSVDDYHLIDGNKVNATTFDCRISSGTHHSITNNKWRNNGYFAGVRNYYEGNTGPYVPVVGDTVLQSKYINVRTTLTYTASIGVDMSNGNEFDVTATNNTPFTLANPTGRYDGKRVTYTIRNTSGGALGTVTWDTLFKLATWTSPATGFSRSITFRDDGTNLVEVNRTTVDVPN